jgi:inosine-uridine preferring nucleoside hydrolase
MMYFTSRYCRLVLLSLVYIGLTMAPVSADRDHDRDREHRDNRIPALIISTDVAIGLNDTHGGESLNPAVRSETNTFSLDRDVTPQDLDDGLALAMALNLDAAGLVQVLGVVPTAGNASLPPQMMVARKIMQELKGRTDIPLAPGATSPASQTYHPIPKWFDGTDVTVEGEMGSFVASCRNEGVHLMESLLLQHHGPVTLLALGPFTDIACLIETAPRHALQRVKEIIALASQLEGESLTINGLVVNDFNVRRDPTAAALLLASKRGRQIPIRLMVFSLSGQTSQKDTLIPFDSATFKGPQPPTPESTRSLQWLLAAAEPRNAFWSAIFGTVEGPFDQYALVASLDDQDDSKLFDCRQAWAYVQQCPQPVWSPNTELDSNGQPVPPAYNAPDNSCMDHGSVGSIATNGSLVGVPAQLLVSLDQDTGPVVRGVTGVDGNVPDLDAPARQVTACIDFQGDDARQEFLEILQAYTW